MRSSRTAAPWCTVLGMRLTHLTLFVALSLCACADATPLAATASATASSAAATGAAWTLVPLRLVATGTPQGDDPVIHFKTIELAADGTVARDGKPTGGKFAADHVEDAGGAVVVKVAPDGGLTFIGGLIDPMKGKFTPDGVALDGGATISVHDDGTVGATSPEGKALTFAAKFDSIPPNGKRAAALLATMTQVFGRTGAASAPLGK
jgi:hypothetical protein